MVYFLKMSLARFVKTTSIWVLVLWAPLFIAVGKHWPPGPDLSFDFAALTMLLGISIAGVLLLKVVLKEPRRDFLPPLCGLLLGGVLPPIGGFLWLLIRPGFEESGMWIWGFIMSVPGAIGGGLAAWSQWVSKKREP